MTEGEGEKGKLRGDVDPLGPKTSRCKTQDGGPGLEAALGWWSLGHGGRVWGGVQEKAPSPPSAHDPGPLLVLLWEPSLVSCEHVSVCWSVCICDLRSGTRGSNRLVKTKRPCIFRRASLTPGNSSLIYF